MIIQSSYEVIDIERPFGRHRNEFAVIKERLRSTQLARPNIHFHMFSHSAKSMKKPRSHSSNVTFFFHKFSAKVSFRMI